LCAGVCKFGKNIESIGYNILKFADDANIFREIKSPQDVARLREDLANLAAWSNDWKMLFNVDKSKVILLNGPRNGKCILLPTNAKLCMWDMHISYNNACPEYFL